MIFDDSACGLDRTRDPDIRRLTGGRLASVDKNARGPSTSTMPFTGFDLRRAETPAPPGTIDFIALARALRPELEAAATETEEKRELSPRIVDRLIEHGFYRMALPRSLGGTELDLATYAQTIEALAMGDGSTAWCVGQASGCAMSAAYLPEAAAEQVFGDRRAVVAWGQGPAKAIACDGGYRVTGKWVFASGIRHATWVGGHAPLFEADGATARRDGQGEPILRTFLFPRAKVRIVDVWHVIGLKGTGSDNYEVDDLFVPNDFTFIRDPDQRRVEAPLYRFPITSLYASGFAAVALGLARSLLDSFIELAGVKTPRLQKSAAKLRENNTVQGQVGFAEARLGSARLYLLGALDEIWKEVQRSGHVTVEQRMLIRLASTYAIAAAREVADMAYHGAGALAVLQANAFERRFRDMHAVTQQVQARQQHFETVGQYILGLEPDLSVV
jgi:alkylation response protein AidB-like acyl-CoA dehydrogenase